MILFKRIVFLLIISVSFTNAAEILCLVGTARHNKPEWTQPLFARLAERGHNLTIITTATDTHNLIARTNYVQLDNSYDVIRKQYTNADTGYFKSLWSIQHMLIWHETKLASCQELTASAGFKAAISLVRNRRKDFGLVLYDATYGLDCLLSLAQTQSEVPIIGLSAGKLISDVMEVARAQDTLNPAAIPYFTSNYPLNMSYWQRLQNHVLYAAEYLLKEFIIRPVQHNLLSKLPNINADRIKLLLVNTHPTIDYVQNIPPSVIEMGGVHITNKPFDLPHSIVDFADEYDEGVVYISLPHVESLGERGLKHLLEVIERLHNHGFIWSQHTRKLLDRQPRNLLVVDDQHRQQDILSLPSVEVFVTHADSFSVQEAVFHGVSILALPLILEQFNNAQRVKERNIGLVLETMDFTKDQLSAALQDLLKGGIYASTVKHLQQSFRNRSVEPLEQAVWHVEQLIALPTAFDHLTAGNVAKLNYFVRLSLDVLLLPFIFVVMFWINSYFLIIKIVKNFKKKSVPKSSLKKSKTLHDKQKRHDKKKVK